MRLSLGLAAASLLLVLAGGARAEDALVPPPAGATVLVELEADGVQIYACEVKEKPAWVFKAPEAALFDQEGRQVGTHFAGPTWEDGAGSVTGEVVARAEPPDDDAIPWLLLRAKSHEGTGPIAAAAFIRRFDTVGGLPPQDGCDAKHVGEEARMRYSATYQFLTAGK